MVQPQPWGTVLFSTVGRTQYGFDIFSVNLNSNGFRTDSERRLTDGLSINYNGHFLDDNQSLVFVSERHGAPRVYLNQTHSPSPQPLPFVPTSLFHDRPILHNHRLYFISAHEQPPRPFSSWSALYSTNVNFSDKDAQITRLTPYATVDYSPAISQSGKFIAVASYCSRPWGGEFHELNTSIVVFQESDADKRVLVSELGGWPTWSGDSTIFFHRQANDGWWSIFRVDIPETLDLLQLPKDPLRVTPPGVHCFTPAAMHDGKRIAVATRRQGNDFRHIELFHLDSNTFSPVTELLNPSFHHYNPFVSPGGGFLGYHRFRGESAPGETKVPHLQAVASPVKELRLLRVNGNFPAFSRDGDFIAINYDFDIGQSPGVMILKSDGSRRWTLVKDRLAFYNAWSPTEEHVIYTSLGPIFQSAKTTVQIARIKFDPSHLRLKGEDDKEGKEVQIPCELKLLTSEETGNNAFPSCSPDGKFVVFRSGRSGHKNLCIVDAANGEAEGDGGSIRRLTEGAWIDTMPSWSPKGDLIAFSSNRHNPGNAEKFSIYVVKPDGSDLRRIEVAGAEEADKERINHVCFSEDGEWILFTSNLGGVTAEPVSWPNQFQPYGDLYAMRLDGSGLRRLTCNAYENGTPAWGSKALLDAPKLPLGAESEELLRGQFREPLWINCDI